MRSPVRRLAPLAAVACVALLAANPPAGDPRVTIDTGALEGRVDSATGVLVFRGVPYAAAPVGNLRWKPPAPAAKWSGVRQADKLGHNCMQGQPYSDIDPYAAGVSEDCLNLNVWTSALGGPRRPVMVWIHGGGFAAGFGGEPRHHGARLAQKGAVVVTLNYRLGTLGFLAHPALAAESPRKVSGNYGLLDQIAALQWVQRNIARFGGDPSRVTIFGESAGGASVGTLVASPLAKGLFHRAILESGTGVGRAVRLATAESLGTRFADSLGLSGATAAKLRAVPAESILAAATRVGRAAPPNGPVIDGWVVTAPVESVLVAGKGNVVPVIVGANSGEADASMGAPTRAFARLMAARGAPTYRFLFSRAGEDSVNRARGAFHSAEIPFVFGLWRPPHQMAGAAPYDSTLAEAMSDYWLAFATTGDPNGAAATGKLPKWPRYEPGTDAMIELGSEIAPRTMWHRAALDSADAAARARGVLRP